ncbi:MAG: NADH-quinone oxidoreductase subunit L [Candidatus Symbiobacter sp.]|nr:NADH-quinone oxidoreductase subunit L [Candidatus Symbiobacter sp.]
MEILIVFLPLLAALIAGFGGRWIGARNSEIITTLAIFTAAILGVMLFAFSLNHGADVTHRLGVNDVKIIPIFQWVSSGSFTVNWSLRLDRLSEVMILVVTSVSAMVHLYSIGYMSHDPSRPRFMAYLSLFTFAMLMLVTANDFLQLYFGWEGVGFASYALIGFWYERDSANKAAIKAFVVNRVGDFGFALGVLAVFSLFGSIGFDAVFNGAEEASRRTINLVGYDVPALTLICLLLFVGAMGKSAQLGLHTWLPDAMEGPTPVSALIHAATMVTAGVFMLCRLSPLFAHAEFARDVVTVVGAATCLFAATVALTQFDIKRVIAYSTCSQLGYMVFAAGLSAYGAAMFHLVTHAAFKALLFLGAGGVIHAMSGEQDMRKMGGIWRLIPVTYGLMWIGSLALAGIPPFAGYYSKHSILEAALASGTVFGNWAYIVGTLVAFLTAIYSFRLIFLAFHGPSRAGEHTMAHVHESPWVMLLPLFVLAAGALLLGYYGEEWFVGEARRDFWQHVLVASPDHDALVKADMLYGTSLLSGWRMILPSLAGGAGILVAFLLYVIFPGWPHRIVNMFAPVHRFFYHKWYFDELYDFLFVQPAQKLGRFLWQTGDVKTIDRFGPDGIAAVTRLGSRFVSGWQTGYVYHYAFAMLIGLVAIISWFLLRQSNGIF